MFVNTELLINWMSAHVCQNTHLLHIHINNIHPTFAISTNTVMESKYPQTWVFRYQLLKLSTYQWVMTSGASSVCAQRLTIIPDLPGESSRITCTILFCILCPTFLHKRYHKRSKYQLCEILL